MEEHRTGQSGRSRAWEDTLRSFKGLTFFWVVEVGLMVGFAFLGEFLVPEGASRFMSGAYRAVGTVIGAIVGFAVIFIIMLMRAPIKQRNEARAEVIEMKKEKEPCIEVYPLACKAGLYERSNRSSWAALRIVNASSEVDLGDVSVQILELMEITEVVDAQGMSKGIYDVFRDYTGWTPANVYWDESNAAANEFKISIPRGATRVALVAFHVKGGSALGFLNTPKYTPIMQGRIVVEVSSTSMNTWRGVYYIEYIPPAKDEFELVEWNSWCESHKVVEH